MGQSQRNKRLERKYPNMNRKGWNYLTLIKVKSNTNILERFTSYTCTYKKDYICNICTFVKLNKWNWTNYGKVIYWVFCQIVQMFVFQHITMYYCELIIMVLKSKLSIRDQSHRLVLKEWVLNNALEALRVLKIIFQVLFMNLL